MVSLMVESYALDICKRLDLNPDTVLKNPIRGKFGYTALDLVTALIYTDTIAEASTLLDYSTGPIKGSIRQHIGPKLGISGRPFNAGKGLKSITDWKPTLLSILELKQCHRCKKIKTFSEFGYRKSAKSTLDYECMECKLSRSSEYKIRTSIRTPAWANLESIKQIYRNCPKGYHVDHVIPLNGINVCGLHVENNLQYLTAIENMAKGNKFSD